MVTEVCLLVGADGTMLWREVSGNPSALPDSPGRWAAIWRLRDRLAEIAHTHPHGPLAFSTEDLTTMAAIDAALGRPLRYAVVTPASMLRREPSGVIRVENAEPAWVADLRAGCATEEPTEEPTALEERWPS